jgi:hypothetical protein
MLWAHRSYSSSWKWTQSLSLSKRLTRRAAHAATITTDLTQSLCYHRIIIIAPDNNTVYALKYRMKRYKVNRNKRCKTNLNKRTESRRIKPWVAREAEHGSTETYTSGRTSAARRQQAARKQGRSNYHSTRQTFHQTSKGRGSGRVQSREGERPQPQTVRGNSSSNDKQAAA